jgi:taurine transport system substrate-binding protein
MSRLPQGPSRRLLLAGALAAVSAAVTGCSSDGAASGSGAAKRLRIGYFAFPSGDLIVKNRKLLEKALPDHKISWIKLRSGHRSIGSRPSTVTRRVAAAAAGSADARPNPGRRPEP